ncbi:MAG: 30S ribosomal protein S1 [Acidobacteria bacterium]|nr:MAG: 30S ribosomal protein S1 [Acidobacteriota bacterium]PYY23760.1 MAG: 30S ribosomal protein S1 [Acidobacteriota bacterium]
MSNPSIPESQFNSDANESFDGLLSQYERSHQRKRESGNQVEGTVVAVSPESVFFDIGFKTEGILSLTDLQKTGKAVKPGDKLHVTVKARDPEGYYQLSLFKVIQPTDWASLEKAFLEKATISGTVTGLIKGGLSVDIGVRAFMPASRSGVRDAAEMEKLVEQEIRCKIIKLDVAEEDVVVDRRAVAEDEERIVRERRYSEMHEGDIVHGEVRSLADYGAFIDLDGVDGLLHVGEISWSRMNKPADVLSVGQQVEAKIIKIDPGPRRISLSIKQLQPHPWESVPGKYKVGERVRGVVTRVMDFGAFVELEPGVEGLIHISEMSWGKKVRKASDVVKPGDSVEAVILGLNPAERRISLGLKQALGDPWEEAAQKFIPGTAVEGPVTSIMNFGAFVQVAEGLEGMIHVSEISAEKRINHPRDILKVGQVVKAQVLALDKEKRQLRLSMKQLVPSSLDEYIAEHKEGDAVTGRVIEASGKEARVELGEGVLATCAAPSITGQIQETQAVTGANLSALTSMLSARWKGVGTSGTRSQQSEALAAGQIRSFRITKIDSDAKQIAVELA